MFRSLPLDSIRRKLLSTNLNLRIKENQILSPYSRSSFNRLYSSRISSYDDETESVVEREDDPMHSNVKEEQEGEWAGCQRQFFAPLTINKRGPGTFLFYVFIILEVRCGAVRWLFFCNCVGAKGLWINFNALIFLV